MATTTTANKTKGTSLIALQSIAASAEVVGSALDVSTKFAGNAGIWFGRTTAVAPTVGVSFRFEAQFGSSGLWVPVAVYVTGITAAHTGTNTSSAGAALTMSSTTNFVVQGVVLVHDGTIANSEWCRIQTVTSGTVLTMEETLLHNSHTTGSTYDSAEIASVPLDLSGVTSLRCVVDGSAHNQGFDCQVTVNTMDSVSTA